MRVPLLLYAAPVGPLCPAVTAQGYRSVLLSQCEGRVCEGAPAAVCCTSRASLSCCHDTGLSFGTPRIYESCFDAAK